MRGRYKEGESLENGPVIARGDHLRSTDTRPEKSYGTNASFWPSLCAPEERWYRANIGDKPTILKRAKHFFKEDTSCQYIGSFLHVPF